MHITPQKYKKRGGIDKYGFTRYILVKLRKSIENADRLLKGDLMHTAKECINKYGSRYRLDQQIEEGKLFHIEQGIYSKDRYVPDLAVICYKYPHGILTLGTAFYLYGMTDTIPEIYDVATDRDASKINDVRVHQWFYPTTFFDQGKTTIEYQGYNLNIYSRERMLIELLRYKTKIPYDLYKEVIQNYRKIMPTLDIQEIQCLAMESTKSNRVTERLQEEVF